MKKLIITSILALLIAGGSAMGTQDWPDEYLGLPGDNLNLFAVMKLFQESETIEGFERKLNDENTRINNLDLNGDNMVDYITVSDYVDGNVHTIVLRAVLTRSESQDVAVFTVEQFRNGEVQIQLVGDEALYGRDYIIEPIYAETPNPGYKGRSVKRSNVTVVTTTYYDVAAWPMISFIYHPSYVVWRSTWYWDYYPVYWNPWRPYYWHYYYGYHYNWYPHYYMHYRHWNHHRYARYNDFYCNRVRAYSPTVILNINKGTYKSTYSRPGQRRDGEALYSRTHSSQTARTQATTATGNQGRRTSAQPVQNTGTRTAGTVATRRSAETASDKSVTGSSAGQNSAVSRRSASTVTDRPDATPSATRSATTARRETATAPARTATTPSATQSTTTARRETAAAPARTATAPSPTQITTNARRETATAPARTATAVSAKSESRPSTTVMREEQAGSSRSLTQVATTASRNSSQVSRSTPAADRSSNAREPETANTRRK